MPKFEILAFDADDTLWHTERFYVDAQNKFTRLLSQYHKPEWVHERLYQTEIRNIAHFGYGIKAFALSMIETAVELTEGRIAGTDIQALVDLAREMLSAEVQLLDHVAETIPELARKYQLMVITKGDLLDQETKIIRSGLSQNFRQIEVVSHKTAESYSKVFTRHGISASALLMVGNSLRSDILPILELGGHAIYIPYETTWLHEAAELPSSDHPGFYQLDHMGQLPALINQIEFEGK
jgi:putative hydrolase of the HAD superfamily